MAKTGGRRSRLRGIMTKWSSHSYQSLSRDYSSSSSTSTNSSGEWADDYDEVVDDDEEEENGGEVRDESFIDGEGRRWPHRIVI